MIIKNWILAITTSLIFVSCDEEQKAEQTHPDIYTDTDDDDDDDDVNNPIDPNTTDNSEAFQSWCTLAGETDIVKNKFQTPYSYLCEGGKPTSLFTTILPGRAYSGSENFRLKNLNGFQHNGNATEATFGTAILIPIDIKTHFDVVGPKNGDASTLEEAAAQQNATAQITFLDSTQETGTHHIRGWKYNIKSEKKVSIITVKSDAIVQADHWMLEDGKLYMYTSYYTEEGTGIFDNNIFTAGLKVGDSSILLSLGYVKADNKGLGSIAEGTITDTAKQIGITNYNAALKAKQ